MRFLGFRLERVEVISDDKVMGTTKEGWLHGAGERWALLQGARAGRSEVTNACRPQKSRVIQLPPSTSPTDT